MIYEKLPVVLLSTLASEKQDSTNAVIARYILSHRRETEEMGIKELAQAVHAGTGSVSRFCKEIGLSDFHELKQLLADSQFHFQRTDNRASCVSKAVMLASSTADASQIQKLCADIKMYEKVAAYGLLKAASAAVSLQADLLMMGKYIDTSIPYAQQLDHILHATEEDLIIIFSYTGSYFQYHSFRSKEQSLMRPKIYMITGSQQPMPAFVDETIRFQSRQDQISHPFQLETIAAMISEEFAAMSDTCDTCSQK